ncbi:MAG: hypothetical protein Q8R61_00855 [Thiobacillus sp.]|uniref:hypothetical protein n=1 Tax=Thiobacillus sp. TaxID=924 RepID=UPI002733D8D5|nr:hypothetical protein [Thiobacillus sp.]MDP3419310.1 hypothetical protein [Thiobacillus sp.]MDP3583651.1 hypothetical protein [Thiobacillus sp.]
MLAPDALTAIRQLLAGANWATGLSAGAQVALVKKSRNARRTRCNCADSGFPSCARGCSKLLLSVC